ncbi:MAG: glycosyltransferase [Paludibacteraceae bacterium]|nr:glycosyltransferase [Paludibacteraceae bacterium]
MKVLYLCEWYPHRYDAMAGLFVRKHAQAVVRQGVEVMVLYLHLDKHIHKEELIEQTTDGVREVYVYYPCKWDYLKALRHGYQHIKRSWGRPDLCQLNVITKNGLLPLYLWKRFSIPYIIIEHWSGYLPMNRAQSLNRRRRFFARLIARNAQVVLPVSQTLMNAMKECGLVCRQWQLINNVVDGFFYANPNTKHQTPNTRHFIHISCFDEKAKNIQGLLRAVHRLAQERQDFHLTLVGTGVDFAVDKAYAESLGLVPDIVSFTGELPPEQVAEELAKSQMLILNSRYETYGIVLAEAASVGIPSIETDTCGLQLPESCGIIVPPEDEESLAEQMRLFIEGKVSFDKEIIREQGKMYSSETVGKELKSIYEHVCNR